VSSAQPPHRCWGGLAAGSPFRGTVCALWAMEAILNFLPWAARRTRTPREGGADKPFVVHESSDGEDDPQAVGDGSVGARSKRRIGKAPRHNATHAESQRRPASREPLPRGSSHVEHIDLLGDDVDIDYDGDRNTQSARKPRAPCDVSAFVAVASLPQEAQGLDAGGQRPLRPSSSAPLGVASPTEVAAPQPKRSKSPVDAANVPINLDSDTDIDAEGRASPAARAHQRSPGALEQSAHGAPRQASGQTPNASTSLKPVRRIADSHAPEIAGAPSPAAAHDDGARPSEPIAGNSHPVPLGDSPAQAMPTPSDLDVAKPAGASQPPETMPLDLSSDEDLDLCMDPGDHSAPAGQEDRRVLLYPLRSERRVELRSGDVVRLQSHVFLNDSVIDFGLRYLEESLGDAVAARVHIFSSFWLVKAREQSKAMGRARSRGGDTPDRGLERWTRNVDIFSRDLLLVPVHGRLHWSLAVVAFPLEAPLLSSGDEYAAGGGDSAACVLYLDSLGGSKRWVHRLVTEQLAREWERRGKAEEWGISQPAFDSMPFVEYRIPRQTNEVDCGLFLLECAERLARSPPSRDRILHVLQEARRNARRDRREKRRAEAPRAAQPPDFAMPPSKRTRRAVAAAGADDSALRAQAAERRAGKQADHGGCVEIIIDDDAAAEPASQGSPRAPPGAGSLTQDPGPANIDLVGTSSPTELRDEAIDLSACPADEPGPERRAVSREVQRLYWSMNAPRGSRVRRQGGADGASAQPRPEEGAGPLFYDAMDWFSPADVERHKRTHLQEIIFQVQSEQAQASQDVE